MEVKEKEELKKLDKMGQILLLCNGRLQNFRIPEK